MADSGTKAEVSHGECVGTEKPSSWAFVRPGVSSRERSINPQQPPEEGLHPWDTSVFVPEFLVCCVLLRDSISFLASFARLSHSGDPHSRVLALGALRAHARSCIFESGDTARVCPKTSLPGTPGRLLVIIAYLRQLASSQRPAPARSHTPSVSSHDPVAPRKLARQLGPLRSPTSARVTQVVSPCSRASAGLRARECIFRCTCRGPRWQ